MGVEVILAYAGHGTEPFRPIIRLLKIDTGAAFLDPILHICVERDAILGVKAVDMRVVVTPLNANQCFTVGAEQRAILGVAGAAAVIAAGVVLRMLIAVDG